jgi:short-subunit dehydrogenase
MNSHFKNSPAFKNKVVIVTGASSGIGRATALAFAKLGAIPVAVARREQNLQTLTDECKKFSPQASYIAADLGQRELAENVIHETVKRYGRIDILVNNAAVPMHKLIYRISAQEAEDVMRVNFLSCLWTTFAAIPYLLKQGGGTIVNVSSFVTKVIPTHETIYAASKYAMNGFTKGLWADLEGSGIHCALVHPGAIATEIWEKLDEPEAYDGKKYPPEVVANDILDAILHKRLEVVSPRSDFKLKLARVMAILLPSLVRKGVSQMDPIKPEHLAWARQRAEAGKSLGDA